MMKIILWTENLLFLVSILKKISVGIYLHSMIHSIFVNRENMIVKSRDIFTAEIDNFESVNKRNISLREILDNSKSFTERQTALEKFYEQNPNSEHIYGISHDTQKIHAQEISEKFAKQIENINKYINEYHNVFVTLDDPLLTVTDVEHSITLKTNKPCATPLYKHPIIMQAVIEKQIAKFF